MAWNGGVYLEGNLSGVGQFITLEQPPGCVLEDREGNAVDEVQHTHRQAFGRGCPLNSFLEHDSECLGGETQDTGISRCSLHAPGYHLNCCN